MADFEESHASLSRNNIMVPPRNPFFCCFFSKIFNCKFKVLAGHERKFNYEHVMVNLTCNLC